MTNQSDLAALALELRVTADRVADFGMSGMGGKAIIDGWAKRMDELAARLPEGDAASPFHGIQVVLNPHLPPDAWVLVPREPTPEMVAAGVKAGFAERPWWLATYRAMINAAPGPPDTPTP